jgi:hypothetical protein
MAAGEQTTEASLGATSVGVVRSDGVCRVDAGDARTVTRGGLVGRAGRDDGLRGGEMCCRENRGKSSEVND